MRVLLVASEYPPAPCGGIGVFYHALARRLAALGLETHVLTDASSAAPAGETSEGLVHVHRAALSVSRAYRMRAGRWRFDARPALRTRARAAIARTLAMRLQADLVETHDWSGPLLRPPLRPFVVRLHGASSVLAQARGEPQPRLQRFLERWMVARADAVIAVSEWIRRETAHTFVIDADKIEVVPNGVDTELFRPSDCPRREEILFAGTLREDKGVTDLLHALEIVLRLRPGASALLAGAPDGWTELAPSVRGLVERVRMTARNRLRLLGRVSQRELAALYQRAAVCVFPSRAEAFGLACAEAMSCGAAVVASALGAGAELVEEGRSGLIVNPRNPAALAEAIEGLIARPELARSLGEAARQRVEERYSIDRTARATLGRYERALRTRDAWRRKHVA